MTVSLKKGDMVSLAKHGLNHVHLELRFDLGASKNVVASDVQLQAFELVRDANNKAHVLNDSGFVFYGQNESPNGTKHRNDPLKGCDLIDADLTRLQAAGITELSITSEIYEGFDSKRKVLLKHFGDFAHLTIHVVNPDTGEEIAHFNAADDDAEYSLLQVGSLVLEGGEWHFKAGGTPYKEGLYAVCVAYGVNASDDE